MARIAIDIDSTLHHYWDLFRSIVRERYGVDLAYEEQTDWGITRIPQEFVREAVSETAARTCSCGKRVIPQSVWSSYARSTS